MNLLNELLSLNERKNELGETEYDTYSGWKTACRKADDSVWFDGNKDIANAFIGTQPYKRGETRAIGEWDGSKGAVFVTASSKKIAKEGLNEGNEARIEQLQKQLDLLTKQMDPLKKRAETVRKQLEQLGSTAVTEQVEQVENLLCEAIEELYEREAGAFASVRSDPTKKLSLSRVHTVMLSPSDAAFRGILKDKVFGIRNEDPIVQFLIDILGVPLDGTPYKIRTGFMKYEAKQKMLFIAKFKADLPGQQKTSV